MSRCARSMSRRAINQPFYVRKKRAGARFCSCVVYQPQKLSDFLYYFCTVTSQRNCTAFRSHERSILRGYQAHSGLT
jgi:hypothetical protein